MEHNANITTTYKGTISSLLKAFAMFELRPIGDKAKLEVIDMRCINCKKETGLYLQNSTSEEINTKFVLDTILHHVGMPWIISSKYEMKYETDKINHQCRFNKGPWYNTDICSGLYGSMLEYFITHARTDRYHLMCYLVAHDKNYQLMKMMKSVLDIG